MTEKKFPAPQAFSEKGYTPIPMTEVSSNQVARIGYSADTQTLAVQFRHGARAIYHYPAVLPETYQAFVDAESKGAFFKQHIKALGFEKFAAPDVKTRGD